MTRHLDGNTKLLTIASYNIEELESRLNSGDYSKQRDDLPQQLATEWRYWQDRFVRLMDIKLYQMMKHGECMCLFV